MIRKLLSRIFRRRSELPSDFRPLWLRDETFMRWLAAAKGGDHDVVTHFNDEDWRRLATGDIPEGSMARNVVDRCRWRWEGWDGRLSVVSSVMPLRPWDPERWWRNPEFVTWHDRVYPPDDQGYTAASMAITVIRDPDMAMSPIIYPQTKALRRRYQGWCAADHICWRNPSGGHHGQSQEGTISGKHAG